MVIDTSAVLAILLNEPERGTFIDALAEDPVRLMSAVSALEAAVVIEARKREFGGIEYDLLLQRAKVDIVSFTQKHMEEAREAWRKFGKGNHPAGLNFCDCCAYALSRVSGEPLLYKGADFGSTDVRAAIAPPKEQMPSFRLKLGAAYHRQGFFNVPASCEQYVSAHDSNVELHLEGVARTAAGRVNRKANPNGTPRIMGGPSLRTWFQSRFKQGDVLRVEIESPSRMRLRA
jgi:ribonuclease VapC